VWANAHVSLQAGTRLIGTDPEEVLAGDAVARFLRNEATALQGRAQVDPGEIEAFVHGDVGWGFARPVVSFTDGPSVSPRWTAVFQREEGTWKLVQLHASVSIANEDVGFENHE
jgi:ketosteroid isomerase-like protein